MELDQVYAPIHADMLKVEDRLKATSQVNFPHLATLLEHCLKGDGKRIRPALTLFSGKFYDYNLDLLLPIATGVEIMHTATLVHDDAIDHSLVRRGRPTINKLWGEEQAVLLGDYLFAEAGSLTASTNNLRAIKLFATTLKTISSGEINQAINAFNLNQTRSQYIQRIAQKTAALFAMATESGSVLSQAPEASIQILIEYGFSLGIAFQIVDDILDFIGTDEELGKPTASDLLHGTVTLPILLLMEQYPEEPPVKKLYQHHDDHDNIKRVIDLVRNSPSTIQECYHVATDYCVNAGRNLKLLPENPARQSLTALADYILSRKK